MDVFAHQFIYENQNIKQSVMETGTRNKQIYTRLYIYNVVFYFRSIFQILITKDQCIFCNLILY